MSFYFFHSIFGQERGGKSTRCILMLFGMTFVYSSTIFYSTGLWKESPSLLRKKLWSGMFHYSWLKNLAHTVLMFYNKNIQIAI